MNDQTPHQTLDSQFPNLVGYLDEAGLHELIRNHTMAEALELESCFATLETAMIQIHRTAEISSMKAIWDAITTIWDNSHDLTDED